MTNDELGEDICSIVAGFVTEVNNELYKRDWAVDSWDDLDWEALRGKLQHAANLARDLSYMQYDEDY